MSAGVIYFARNGFKSQEFTSNSVFIVPDGVDNLYFVAAGAGGGGGSGGGISANAGGGGGAGGEILQGMINVIPADSLTITIGIGGAGPAGSINAIGTIGGNGTSTSILLPASLTYSAFGGLGGGPGITSTASGGLGQGVYNTVGGDTDAALAGEDGEGSQYNLTGGGTGGVLFSDGSGPYSGGGGGGASYGDGGNGGFASAGLPDIDGLPGVSGGGGGGGSSTNGGGATSGAGGNGGSGIIILYWKDS